MSVQFLSFALYALPLFGFHHHAADSKLVGGHRIGHVFLSVAHQTDLVASAQIVLEYASR